jgi:hypothetical protein
MDTLGKLFGSPLRIRMMRLFLFNADSFFDLEYIEQKSSAKKREIVKELDFLKKLGLIKKKKGAALYTLDRTFRFAEALSAFLVSTYSLERKAILRKIEKTGRIKTVLMAGIFTNDPESRLDLFVIGDNVKTNALAKVVKGIEADMGKEIRYTVISAPDFAYRTAMNDKLIRDVMDYPHETLVDKLGISKA